MNFLKQIVIALDQLGNTLLGGWADETLSSRAHRLSMKGKDIPKKIINSIFYLQTDHCKEAYESEISRYHLPPAFRRKCIDINNCTIEIEKLDTTPSTWIIRLNGDGNTFDAVCTVLDVEGLSIEVKGLLSNVEGGAIILMKKVSPYFSELGYTFYEYTHKGKKVRRSL